MRYALHPSNHSFSWQEAPLRLARAEGKGLTDAQVAAFHRDGCVAVHDVFSADEVAAMLAEIDPLEAAAAHLRTKPNGRVLISRADEITFRPHLVLQDGLAVADVAS